MATGGNARLGFAQGVTGSNPALRHFLFALFLLPSAETGAGIERVLWEMLLVITVLVAKHMVAERTQQNCHERHSTDLYQD